MRPARCSLTPRRPERARARVRDAYNARVGAAMAREFPIAGDCFATLWRLGHAELLADSGHRSAPNFAVSGHRRAGTITHPHVVGGAVAREPGAVAAKPAFEVSALHSADARAAAVRNGAAALRGGANQLVTQFAKLADQFAESRKPRLDGERDPFSTRRLVREIVKRVKHVEPGLSLCSALRYCGRIFDDLGRDPAILIFRVGDGQPSGLDGAGLWRRRHAHTRV
jgi:hypothetical protein